MLTSRQLTILKTIIESYVVEREPIGSKRIANLEEIKASSATVRNEMSVLEELNLLTKTHSSSGRIPSTLGYRYYIDHLMEPKEVDYRQAQLIDTALEGVGNQIGDIFNKTAHVLSEITNYTSIVLGPSSQDIMLTHFQFIPLSNEQILAVIQTDKNTVESLVFKVSTKIDPKDLVKLANIFNEHLVNQNFNKVFHKLKNDIPIIVHKHVREALPVLLPVENILQSLQQDKQYYISGKPNLLDFASSLDMSQVKLLYEWLEEDMDLKPFFNKSDPDIHVKIGNELEDELFNHLSLFTARYNVHELGQGIIAILGPLDMSYSKTYGVLNAMRDQLTNELFQRYLK